MTYVLENFDHTASATAYGQKPKVVGAEQLATAEGENCAYGPTLTNSNSAGIPRLVRFQLVRSPI